ncbi:uncharacterized protein LOC127544681 isoform X1 [Antechinus flavipes]|uniref:uncharacterized protein LOC127544681 isoform X1 n=1 Tax=Antechinus flavipes TaxID=38775 RepID=UPI0022361F6D|nr:uncharacterized protein LOC127544681 isoform X1 [Antechinus flavipes]
MGKRNRILPHDLVPEEKSFFQKAKSLLPGPPHRVTPCSSSSDEQVLYLEGQNGIPAAASARQEEEVAGSSWGPSSALAAPSSSLEVPLVLEEPFPPGWRRGPEKAMQAWADKSDRSLLERTPDTRSETSSSEITSEASSKWDQGDESEAEEEQTRVISIKKTFGDPRSKKVHPAPPTEYTTCQEMLYEPSFNWPLGKDAQGQQESPASSPAKGRQGLWKRGGKVQPALEAKSKTTPRTDPEQSSSSAQRQGRRNRGHFPVFWKNLFSGGR